MELAASDGDLPEHVAIAALVYSAATFIGMALYGIDRWIERGEAFSVYFNLFSRIARSERRDGDDRRAKARCQGWRRSAAARDRAAPRGDDRLGQLRRRGRGPSRGSNIAPDMSNFFQDLGLSPESALAVTYTIGLLLAIGIVYGFYRLGIAGARTVGGGFSSRPARQLVHPLARADRVRVRGGALLHASAVRGAADLARASDR